MPTSPERFLPLRPVEIQILLSLQTVDRHGYGILRELEAAGSGTRGAPGMVTLYRALKRLEKNGMVARSGSGGATGAEERRRLYRITPLGTRVLRAEALRLRPLVQAALVATAGIARTGSDRGDAP